jgi:hypothetical protein
MTPIEKIKRPPRAIYTKFGQVGEEFVAHRLKDMGYTVLNVSTTANHDLELESGHRIEVKSATLSKSGRHDRKFWQFSFCRMGVPVSEDIIFLLCYIDMDNDPVTFVIPGDKVFPFIKKITVPNTDPFAYNGKWSVYREKWSLVEKVVAMPPRDTIAKNEIEIPF